MKNLGQAMIRVAKVMEGLEADEQAELARQIGIMYGRPLTGKERQQRYRLRYGAVTASSDEVVTRSGDEPVTLDTSSFRSSSPETTAESNGNYRKVQREQNSAASRLIAFLNEKAGRSFRDSLPNRGLILARLRDGITEQNLRGIIARKCAEWSGTEMAKYLRPETLFNRTKCEQYLGERRPE